MALSPADDDPRKPHDLDFEWAKGTRDDQATCIAIFVPKQHHRGMPGFLHGGLAATALDETMASVGLVLHDQRCLTATLELRYRRAVALDGRPITVEAWRADKRGGSPPEQRNASGAAQHRQAKSRRYHVVGELRDGDGNVCVEAKGLFLAISTTTWDGLRSGGAS